MKQGDKVNGLGFENHTIENIYTDLVASGTNEYKEVTMVALSAPGTDVVKHEHMRNISKVVERLPDFKAEVHELEAFEPKWEYDIVEVGIGGSDNLFEILKQKGELGWEFVNFQASELILKRIKQDS